MASQIVNLLGGGFLDGVSKVIDSIRGKSPEDAAKLAELQTKYQTDFMNAQAELEKAKIQENVSLNETAGLNVRADAQSGDKFTSRARPGVIWVGLLIMAWNYMAVPLIGIHYGLKPVEFPSMFWEVWGIVATGVVFTRTADKLFGGLGGSAQLPLGIKIESKGDKA